MAPNGYRSHIFPAMAVAAATIGDYDVPTPPGRGQLSAASIMAATALFANEREVDCSGWHVPPFDFDRWERLAKINKKGIPYPVDRRRRKG